MEERYRHLVVDGYEFEMSKYVSEGWDLFKKGAGSFIGFVLLYFIISIVLNFIPFVNLLAGFVQQTLVAGMFIFSRNLLNKNEGFGNFFGGFQFFGNIAGYLLLTFLILIPLFILLFTAIIPFELIPQLINPDMNDLQYLLEDLVISMTARIPLILLISLLFIYVAMAYSLALPLIVDSKLGSWKAMETSRRVVTKKFLPFLGLYLIMGILGSIGIVLTCGLGMLVVFPFCYCILFSAYNNIFNPQSAAVENQIDQFGASSSDINTESEENQ